MTTDNYSSEFNVTSTGTDGSFDFSHAQKIEVGGSVCECYEGRHHRRRVFVKRLKPEFRKSSLHLAALDKEFDVGVLLNHPALPHYLEIHGDYIIMDFIDGQSLQQLILNRDSWLKNERNIFKFLRELVDVLDYLHLKRVFHADLKSDNILITNNPRSVVLIDFDKSHVDWLDDTDGNPKRFGFDEDSKEYAEWDFRGLAQIALTIAEELNPPCKKKLKGFAEIANKKGISSDELKDYISNADGGKNKYRKYLYGIPVVAAIIIIIFVISLFGRQEEIDKPSHVAPVEEVLPHDTEISTELEEPATPSRIENIENRKSQERKNVTPQEPATTENALKETLKKDISQQFPAMVRPHLSIIDESLREIRENSGDMNQLRESYERANKDLLSFILEINKFFVGRHQELTEMEVIDILYASPEYNDFYIKCKSFLSEYEEAKEKIKKSRGEQ